MGRMFRLKYTKIVSVLMAGAILVGGMDVNVLSVQAAVNEAEASEAMADMNVVGSTAKDSSANAGGAVIDEPVEEDDADDQAAQAAAAAESAEDSADSERMELLDDSDVEIKGGTIADSVYSGGAMSLKDLIPSDLSVELGSSGLDSDDCDYYYSYSGITAEGSKYNSGNPMTASELEENTDFEGPKDAGTYTCTVSYAAKRDSADTALENIYATKDITFQITAKQIKIKAKNATIKKGEAEPSYTYEYDGEGLADGDSLTTEPTLSCDIKNTDTPGTYTISVSGADAGSNYEITYQDGILTIEDDDDDDTGDTARKLASIVAPSPVTGVRNGTPLDEIKLPGTVTIKIVTGDSTEETEDTADVEWNRTVLAEGTYDPADTEEQTFKLQGTVKLPDGVDDNGKSLTVEIEITVAAESEEPETPKEYQLLRVITPSAVREVVNGTAIDQMVLPETVTIVVQDISATAGSSVERRQTAAVTWDRTRTVDGTSYQISNENEQSFKLRGTVELPADVDDNGIALTITLQVYVREKVIAANGTVAYPTASIMSGETVSRGTTVELSCETEDATIYYTLDGTEPTRDSNRYSTPIALNTSTTVIRAFAVKKGYTNSMVVKFTYRVIDSGTTGGSDDEDEPEVPKEDIPADGIIPDGLWTTTVEEYVYTGKAIKPEVRVYDYKTLLVEKKDYTITYKNNTNAASADSAKAPTITITGKGNYEGKLTKTFTIAPKNINDADVTIDDIAVMYNKKAQKPTPSVVWNGKKLTNKKDYTVQAVSYTDAGSYNVTVTGSGNYQGERKFNFTIVEDGVLVSKLTVSKIPNQVYTGKAITPQLTVKEKSTQLTQDLNYTVTYENNLEVGTATAIIKGIGRYVGTKKVTFKITEVASLSKASVTVQFNTTPVYTGQAIGIDGETVTVNVKDENGTTVPRTLVRNTDYTVTYQNNIKAGTATVLFTGIGAYRGTAKKTFKITACDITSDKVQINLNASYPYEKGGCKAEPVISFGGKKLTLGTDYTLTYKQNNAAGSIATVTIKGKGNFKGSVAKTFTVAAQNIENVNVSAADKVYQNKKNIYKTTVRLTDTNGKALSAGTDYDKNFEYAYEENTFVHNMVLNASDPEEKTLRKAGDPVDVDDIIPAGTVIRVTVIAKGANYTGTVYGTYRIAQASIASAKVTIPVQIYTGKAIKPSASDIAVTIKGVTIPSSDYEIVEYSNNINKGTAKLVIHGLNGYGGTKTVSFKIKSKGLFGL